MTTPQKDDLDAVRSIAEILKDFKNEDRERILRWVSEKLNMPLANQNKKPNDPNNGNLQNNSGNLNNQISFRDLFNEKKPTTDTHFATTVAYYYQFIAPEENRKSVINKDDLQDAARLAPRERFSDPRNTLNNAVKSGFLDNGDEAGTFKINTVGENLVSMTLPSATKKIPKKKSPKKNKKM